MERKEALLLLKEQVKSESLLRHSYAVEGAMRGYARLWDEDVEYWGMIGLLHDIDFEKYPEEHPSHAPDLLQPAGFDKEFTDTILSHGLDGTTLRTTKIRKTLHAVDQMSGFIVAVALMRPTRFEGLAAKSVKKKMKDKRFSAAVNREELQNGWEELGVEFSDHVATIVSALTDQEVMLQKEGSSLLG